jgi:hypothetical protein
VAEQGTTFYIRYILYTLLILTTVAIVTASSLIVVDDPTFLDKVVESRPLPAPYDLNNHMDTNSLEQLCQEVYGDPSWVRRGLIQKGEGVVALPWGSAVE